MSGVVCGAVDRPLQPCHALACSAMCSRRSDLALCRPWLCTMRVTLTGLDRAIGRILDLPTAGPQARQSTGERVHHRRQVLDRLCLRRQAFLVDNDVREGILPPAIDSRHPEDQAAARDKTDGSVSCRHISEHTSVGMWRLYSVRRGLEVQSTVGRLHAAVEDAGRPYSLVKVGYFDCHPRARELPEGFPEAGVWREDDRLPFCCKPQAYAFEQELRVLRQGPSDPPQAGQLVGLDRYELGVQPDDLVERVYVHPRIRNTGCTS